MTAEEYLKQIQKLDCLINNKLAERERLFSMATNINQTLSGMPHNAGVTDKVGDGAVKLADMESEIDRMVDEYADKKSEVTSVIENPKILTAKEYDAIHMYFIQEMTWEDIAQSFSCSVRKVYYIRDRALKKIQRVIDKLQYIS